MNYVIIGGSAAGVTAAETIRKFDEKSSVTVISNEAFGLYSRCLLTYYIAGAIDESKLYFKDKNFYKDNKIITHLGKTAVSIDRKKKTVLLDDKKKVSYDKLLIATGASPKLIDAPGVEREGVFTLRKLDDSRGIIKLLDNIKSCVVLGGGLIGLRDAYALRKREKEVIVIVKSRHILSQMLDAEAASIIAAILEKNGIKIETGVDAKEILGAKFVEAVLLDNGERIDCQMVIVGKGVAPNAQIASSCGIEVKEGIVVNQFLETSDKDIFAAGDVATTNDLVRSASRINALWPCAVEQGQTAGFNMLGRKKKYDGSLSMNSIDFFGTGCISIGITEPKEGQYEVIKRKTEDFYKKLVLKDSRIVGAVLVGDIKSAGIYNALIRNKIDVSGVKDILLSPNFDYAKIMPLVKQFTDKFVEKEFEDTLTGFSKL